MSKRRINFEETFEQQLRRFLDGEPKNIDPLKEIPQPKITIYVLETEENNIYFDTLQEQIEYIKNNKDKKFNSFKIEYLGYVAGRHDVIRTTRAKNEQFMLTPTDNTKYEVYSEKRSFYTGNYIWEENQGSLKSIYDELKKRGIKLSFDVYDNEYIKINKMVRVKNI